MPPGLTVNPTTGAHHRHAHHSWHLHVHRAFPVDDWHHRLPDGHDHGGRRRRRRERRCRGRRTGRARSRSARRSRITLNVSNAGPAPATNVRLTDTLPEGTALRQRHDDGRHRASTRTARSSAPSARSRAAARPRSCSPSVRQSAARTRNQRRGHRRSGRSRRDQQHRGQHHIDGRRGDRACTTVCFSGPTSYIASPADAEFGGEKGDFNGDGVVDLIYGPVGRQYRRHPARQWRGRLRRALVDPIPGTPDAAAVADFNNDGHQDVVSCRNAR